MDVQELARLGEQMREQQKRFFAGDKGAIVASKDYERRFDRAVKAILHPEPPGLFDPPQGETPCA